MSTNSVGSSSSTSKSTQTSASDRFAALGTGDFVKLFVTELQKQDPLNPMDNAQMLQQMSNIQAIQSNKQLSDTLVSMQLGQAVTTAGTLLGRQISALDTQSKTITGVVDRITVTDGAVKLHIGDKEVDLKNVREVQTNTSASQASSITDLLNSLLNSKA